MQEWENDAPRERSYHLYSGLVDDRLDELADENIHCLDYADDLAIIVKNMFTSMFPESAQRSLQIAHNWWKTKELPINARKTTIVA